MNSKLKAGLDRRGQGTAVSFKKLELEELIKLKSTLRPAVFFPDTKTLLVTGRPVSTEALASQVSDSNGPTRVAQHTTLDS